MPGNSFNSTAGNNSDNNGNNTIKCSYCKWDVTGIDISKMNNKCPRCRSGLFTENRIPNGAQGTAAPRFRDATTPPGRQRGNVLMPNDPNIPNQ